MKKLNNKIIENLSLLDQTELKQFGKWINSDWCNSNKALRRLFKALKPYYPDFENKKLTKEFLFDKIYPEKPFNNKMILNLMSYLSKEVERFIIHSNLDKNKTIQNRLLMETFEEKNQPDLENELLTLQINELEFNKVKSITDYFQLSNLYDQKYRQPASYHRQTESTSDYLTLSEKYLNQLYALLKIRLLTERFELSQVSKKRIDITDEINYWTHYKQGNEIQAFKVYLQYLKTERPINREGFSELKSVFFNSLPDLNATDRSRLFIYILNEAARMRFKGLIDLNETLTLFKIGLKKKLLLNKNRMTANTYANIVSMANSLKDFSFIRSFIKKYTPSLAPSLQEDASNWASAQCAYHSKSEDMESYIPKLDHRKKEYTTFSLRIRVLVTQIRWDIFALGEQDIEDDFWKYNQAFAKQLEREKKFSKKHIEALRKFNFYTKKLADIIRVNSRDYQELNRLLDIINAEGAMHAKEWLKEKIIEKIGRSRSTSQI